MTKSILIIASMVLIISCSKNESCLAKNADGADLYEVSGKDVCNQQINQENGEYCDCAD